MRTVGIFASALVVFFLVPSLAVAQNACPQITRILELDSRGADVASLQVFLTSRGYFSGTASGYFDIATQRALQQYQAALGIVSSGSPAATGWGVAGPTTREALAACKTPPKKVTPPVRTVTAPTRVSAIVSSAAPASGVRTLSLGMRGADVTALQTFLISQGLLTGGSATGYFGPLTEAAVKRFQSQRGIVSSGTPTTTGYGAVGPMTRAALANSSTSGVPPAQPTGPSSSPSPAPTGPSLLNSLLAQVRALQERLAALTATERVTPLPQPPSPISLTPQPQPTLASCALDGVTLKSGSSQTFYSMRAPPHGSQCSSVSQLRTCTNGALSGSSSYQYGSCVVFAPQSCVFNGQTIAHGSPITAYQSASVPFGSQCASQTRTCANGVLSGSYAAASCVVGTASACTWNGASVTNGSSVSAYQSATVPYGQTCASQTRTCQNGVLSGTYQYASCSTGSAASCTFNGQTVVHGSPVTAYQSASVPFGSQCVSQTRTCSNGVLSGTYQYANCTPGTAASCVFNGQTVNHSASVTAYQASSVPFGSQCVSQTRACSNGVLSGTYTHASCTVEASQLPALSFSASPDYVSVGGHSILSWNAPSASSCTVSGSGYTLWNGTSGTGDTATYGYPSSDMTYTLTCTYPGGQQQSAQTIMYVAPVTLANGLMPTMKRYACLFNNVVTVGGLNEYDEYVSMLARSNCLYLSRAVELWIAPPNFDAIRQKMDYLRGVTGKDFIHGMFVAEAIPTSGTYKDPYSTRMFDFSKMCGAVSYGYWCHPSFNKPEYREYLRVITRKAIDIGVQDFTFGDLSHQDDQWRTNPQGPEIYAEMRHYAASKGKQIAIGGQSRNICRDDASTCDYWKSLDYAYVPMFQDAQGNIGTSDWWDWNHTGITSRTDILVDLEWWGNGDDTDLFSEMSKQARDTFILEKTPFLRSIGAGFLLPFSQPGGRRGGCYGPVSGEFSPSNKYSCQNEDAMNAALSGSGLFISVDQHNIPYGGNTTLRWSAPGASSCGVSAAGYTLWTGTSDATTISPDHDFTYTLTCQMNGGGQQSAQTTVRVTGGPGASSGTNSYLANALAALESVLKAFLERLGQ